MIKPTDSNRPSAPDLVWIAPGFALGSRPYALQREAIFHLGIRAVVSVDAVTDHETRAWQSLGVRLTAITTRDWVAIPVDNFDRVVREVTDCLSSKTPVLLHCLAGINRAPTFAAAVLCANRKIGVDDALDVIMRARRTARPTPEQETSLRAWADLRLTKPTPDRMVRGPV